MAATAPIRNFKVAGTKLGDIIHLHDINQLPPHSAFHEYLDVFRERCAEPRSLILGTTKWGHNIKHGQGKPNLDGEQDHNANSEHEHQGSAHCGERHLKNLKEDPGILEDVD